MNQIQKRQNIQKISLKQPAPLLAPLLFQSTSLHFWVMGFLASPRVNRATSTLLLAADMDWTAVRDLKRGVKSFPSALLHQHPPQQILHNEQPAVLESPGRTSETPQGTQGTASPVASRPHRDPHTSTDALEPSTSHPRALPLLPADTNLCTPSQGASTQGAMAAPPDLCKHVGLGKPRAVCPKGWKKPL